MQGMAIMISLWHHHTFLCLIMMMLDTVNYCGYTSVASYYDCILFVHMLAVVTVRTVY